MLVANKDAPTRGQERLRFARKKRELSAEDFLRTARYRPRSMLELKTTRQIAQSTKPREKDIYSSLDIQVAVEQCPVPGARRPLPAHAIVSQARADPLEPETGNVHCAVSPPSMTQLQPVIEIADGPNKKATKSAISSTVMNLFSRKRCNRIGTTICPSA